MSALQPRYMRRYDGVTRGRALDPTRPVPEKDSTLIGLGSQSVALPAAQARVQTDRIEDLS